ncbi:MAG: hypothetical protein KBG01_07130, partial [Syntrophobacterales bacterium]|nr:hypothetical protein [Syntrophobacterales bacterium]
MGSGFSCGEWKSCRDLVHRFSDFQRLASSSCRCGYIDLCIGAAAAMADYNDVASKSHSHHLRQSRRLEIMNRSKRIEILNHLKVVIPRTCLADQDDGLP